ncbi:MAG: lysophospholipid acyltransferase family protein [Pyrinomonadaceae bacterium]|nr:lysophospholipid acyltransferase family protein [Pyrinomonadaceae bacterium]
MGNRPYRKTRSAALQLKPLSDYPISKRIAIYLTDYALFFFIHILGKTIRFDLSELEKNNHLGWQTMKQFTTKKPPCIAAFWHDRILLTTYFWRFSNYAAMVSESFDGEYIARVSQRFGHGIARGSSTRGGTQALRKMIKLLKKDKFSLTLTVDGPKGPRYNVKPGAVLLAKITGTPIVPILIQPLKFWTLNSWDKLQIPMPFGRAKVFVKEPIFVNRDATEEDLKSYQQELQSKLDELVLLGKQWRESKD